MLNPFLAEEEGRCGDCGRVPLTACCTGVSCSQIGITDREDPDLRRLYSWCPHPRHLDRRVRPAVLYLRRRGVVTVYSCEGHTQDKPTITVWSRADLDVACVLLARWGARPHVVWTNGYFHFAPIYEVVLDALPTWEELA